MTDQDRERMSTNLGIDASDFKTRIVLATGNERRARDAALTSPVRCRWSNWHQAYG